jgi:Rap1a immunity proteins
MRSSLAHMAAGCALVTALHPAAAQVALVPTASALEQSCRAALRDGPTPPTSPIELCAFVIVGYLDGLRAGANRGLRAAFLADQKNLDTTTGLQDLQRRMSIIRPKAQCLPPQVTIRQIIEVYVNYMQIHPERRSQPYSEPLLDALESYFCTG